MSARLNIGLIGSGFMGQAHADAYRRAAMFYPDLPKRPHLYALADQDQAVRGQKFDDENDGAGAAFPRDGFPETGFILEIGIFQLFESKPFPRSEFFSSCYFH